MSLVEMGIISRKIFPSCGNLCVCCPALRPSSRRPVKRYKKLLAEIFPKTQDGPVNDRKILKLCEYAAKNPLRIPKIAKFLEQRSHKELRFEHVNFIKIITETYGKLLFICKEQMAYFAISLVNVANELLDSKHQDIQILGCQTLTRFIYTQTDNTYARNIESLLRKVCTLSHENGENQTLIRAASLQCLSSVIWFMTEYSYIFSDFDEIINSILENYRKNETNNGEEERNINTTQHNWVDEIVRCEGRASAIVTADVSPRNTLTQADREQQESPEVWSHICVQKLAELAEESSTMRLILEPMFIYFDNNKQWAPRHGLALLVLSDMSHLEKSSGNEQLIMTSLARHLDHKNISSDPQLKSDIIQTLTSLARQLRSRGITAELAVVSDLCRHLRKCLEALAFNAGELEECNLNNESLQNSIEDCLLDIVKGMNDSRPIFDMMAITLEKLPAFNAVSRATIGSLLILSHIISLTSLSSQNLTVFPELLLLQIIKCMTHPDQETRLGAHLLFSSILVKAPHQQRGDSEYLYETKKWQSRTTSVFASATALLEKLRREKEGLSGENNNNNNSNNNIKSGKSLGGFEGKIVKNYSVFFTKLGFSVFDRIAVSASTDNMENNIIMLSEDQTGQILSAIWIQANQSDNLPFNYEAIAHSFSLTLLASRLKNSINCNTVRFFQLPLSLRNVALSQNENLSPVNQRSIFTLTISMLAFSGKIYNIPELTDSMKCFSSPNIDPYLRIGEDLQLYVRHQSDLNSFGLEKDYNTAKSILNELRGAIIPKSQVIGIIVNVLSSSTNLEKDVLASALNESFVPDDVPLFGSNEVFDWAFSEESLSLDEECSRSSSVDGGIIENESPAVSFPSFISSKMPTQQSLPHVISVGQLLESALHVAGQVAGTSVSTSPLPYGTMTNQCETLGMGSRKKLSSWLINNNNGSDDSQDNSNLPHLHKVNSYSSAEIDLPILSEPWRSLKLPPASPFDNFLKAAGC